MSETMAFVGLDVRKATVSVAIAEAGRLGEIRHIGTIENTPTAIAKLARRIGRQHKAVRAMARCALPTPIVPASCCGVSGV